MATWYRKSPGGSTYEVFTNGSTTFSTAGRWYIKYVDDSGCETESTYDVTRCCTCNDFSASKNSVSFASIGGSDTVTFSLTGSCGGSLSDLTCSVGSDTWITTGFNSSHSALTITVGSYSGYNTNRTGHTVVSYGDCDVVNIEVVQEKPTPGACTCSDFRVGSSPDAIPATGGSATVTWEFTGSCTSILVTPSVPTEATWCHVTTGNGVFNITVDNYPYSSGVTNRSVTITPLLGGNRVPCTSGVFTVTQLAPEPECSCNEFTLTGATNITSSSQSNAVIGTYTLPSCTGSITSYTSDADWVSNLSCNNGTVYGNVTENTSTSSRSGNLSLTWSGGGLTCTKTVTFTQEGGTPPTTGCTKMFEVNSHYSILMLYANDYVDEMPSVLYATNTDAENINVELESIHADGYVGFRLEPDEFGYSRKIYRLKDNSGNVEFVEGNITKPYGDADNEFVLVYIQSFRWDSTLNKYIINVATYDVYTPSFSDCGQEPDCQVDSREFAYNLSWPSTVTAGTTTWELTLGGAIVATTNEEYNCDNHVGYYGFDFSMHNTIGDKSKTSGYITDVSPFDSITGETYEVTKQGSINRDKNMPSSQADITNISAPENAYLKWNDRTITLVKEEEEISSNECNILYKEQSASAGFELAITIQVYQTAVNYGAVLYE